MPAIFKHNNKLFQCMNLQKKLKKMKLTNVEIIWEGDCSQEELEIKFNSINNSKKEIIEEKKTITYYYYKLSNGGKRVSVEPLDNLELIEIKTYEI